jgi:hypothetical protein
MKSPLGSVLRLVAFVVASAAGVHGARGDEEPSRATEYAFRIQNYEPAIDSEFEDGSRPYALAFGSGGAWGARFEYARTFSGAFGTVGAGLGIGYFGASGHGFYRDPTSGKLVQGRDSTALHVIPASLFVMYRFDQLVRNVGIPLAPYARAGLDRYMWVTTGTAQATMTGATNGYDVTLGIALFLDRMDKTLAWELFRETGIRHVCLTFEATKAVVNDFGSRHSWNLSSVGWALAGGITVMF